MQEGIHAQLIAQILLGSLKPSSVFPYGGGERIQHVQCGLVVLRAHKGIAQKREYLLAVLALRVVLQESGEGFHALAQGGRVLVGAERVVIQRLFAHARRQPVAYRRLVCHLRLLLRTRHGQLPALAQLPVRMP